MKVLRYPNAILRDPAKPIVEFGPSLKELADKMLETMYGHGGIGLAAPQVGHSIRLIVVDVSGDRSQPLVMVNPRILKTADEFVTYREGCLSFPGLYETLRSRKSIEIEYQGLDGKIQTYTAEGLLSVCIQHEIDHLDGRLMIDRIQSPSKRVQMKTRFLKG